MTRIILALWIAFFFIHTVPTTSYSAPSTDYIEHHGGHRGNYGGHHGGCCW